MQKERLKLCLHCNAQSDLAAMYCPYCGQDFSTQPDEENLPIEDPLDHRSLSNQQTLSSLYPPPYQPKVSIDDEDDEQAVDDAYLTQEEEVEQRNTFLPIILMTIGVQLFLIGFFLLCFSTNGVLTLSFNSSYWFIYLLISLPMLFYGIRLIKQIE